MVLVRAARRPFGRNRGKQRCCKGSWVWNGIHITDGCIFLESKCRLGPHRGLQSHLFPSKHCILIVSMSIADSGQSPLSESRSARIRRVPILGHLESAAGWPDCLRRAFCDTRIIRSLLPWRGLRAPWIASGYVGPCYGVDTVACTIR